MFMATPSRTPDGRPFACVFAKGGRNREETATQQVAFAGPNKLNLQISQDDFQLSVVCDGEQLVAKIAEQATNNFAGQVVIRAAPDRLTMDNLLADAILYNYMTAALVPPMQSELLLAQEPLAELFGDKVGKRLLEDDLIDGRPCYRVQVDAVVGDPKEGFLVFWIDRENHLLRRLEHPTKAITDQFAGAIDEAKLQVDYQDVALDAAPAADAFAIEIPDDADRVGFFVQPPPAEPLEQELYGVQPANLSFAAAGNARLRSADLAGKVVVLVWFTGDDGNRATLDQLARIRNAYQGNEKVAFYGVSTDTLAVSNRLLNSWKIDLPVVADDQLHGRDTFQIRGLPTLIALGVDGKLHYAELGHHAQLAATLTPVIEELLQGKDVAARELLRMSSLQAAYQQKLQEARQAGTTVLITLDPPELLPAKAARQLKLTKLWSAEELVNPGNIAVVGEGDGQAIYIFDGWRTLVELDAQGKTVARRELPLPEREVVGYLRTALDSSGNRWFAASARMGRQVHLFDNDWKLKRSYPAADQQHDGIRDVRLADLDGDGMPEMVVGFWGIIGVHAISLEGKNIWRNREFSNVLSVIAGKINDFDWRKVFVTGFDGGILRINHFGNSDKPYTVDGQGGSYPIHFLHAARFAGGQARYCGISADAAGEPLAVGTRRRRRRPARTNLGLSFARRCGAQSDRSGYLGQTSRWRRRAMAICRP